MLTYQNFDLQYERAEEGYRALPPAHQMGNPVTDILSHATWSLIGLNPYAWPYAPVNDILGLITGCAGCWGVFCATPSRIFSAIIRALFALSISLYSLAEFAMRASERQQGATPTEAQGDNLLPGPRRSRLVPNCRRGGDRCAPAVAWGSTCLSRRSPCADAAPHVNRM